MARSWLVASALAAFLAATLQGCIKNLKSPSSGTGSTNQPARGVCSPMESHGHRLDCGPDVEVCGVLALEMGTGSGAYHHPHPVVHGLWPETPSFGTSKCEYPEDPASPRRIYPCYNTQGSSNAALSFQRHEWEKHGRCAGVDDADDFFRQVCALAEGPLQVMDGARASGLDLVDTASQLQRAGYCVFEFGTQKQLQLSACKDQSGRWHLADVRRFYAVCGKGDARPPSGGGGDHCVSGQRGPSCNRDSDCFGYSGCLRCAGSGHCTDVPLRSLGSFRNATTLLESSTAPISTEHSAPVDDIPLVQVTAACAFLLTVATAALLMHRWSTGQSGMVALPLMASSGD